MISSFQMAAAAATQSVVIPGYPGVTMPFVKRCTCRCTLGLALDALSGRPMTKEEVGQLCQALLSKDAEVTELYEFAVEEIADKKPRQHWPIGHLAKCVMERKAMTPAQIVQVTLAVYYGGNKVETAFVKASQTLAATAETTYAQIARANKNKSAAK
jgi:hypothetical protein